SVSWLLRNRGANLFIEVCKARNSIGSQGFEKHAGAPARVQNTIQQESRRHSKGNSEIQPCIVLAIGGHAGINGYYQNTNACCLQTLKNARHSNTIAGKIGLIPVLPAFFLKPFKRNTG